MAGTKGGAGKGASSEDSADKKFIEHLRHIAEYRFREERDEARRMAVAARQRRRLLDRVTKKLGVPLEHFDALHAADWKLIQRQAKTQERAAFALIRRHHARQRTTLRTVLKNRERFEYKKGNPVFQTCLWRATGAATAIVIPFTINEGVAGFAPPAAVAPPPTPGNNLIRFAASAQAAVTGIRQGIAGAEFITGHVFQTTAQIDGVLTVTAQYAPLGTVFLGAPGDCVGFGGSASVRVTLFMNVRVTPAGGFPIDLPVGETRDIVDERIHAGCDGVTRLIPVGPSGGESFQLIHPDVVAVAAGDTIRVAARFALRLSTALRGSAFANFSTAPAGFNVPMVLVKIAS